MTECYHWDGPDEELYHCRLPLGWTRWRTVQLYVTTGMDQMENQNLYVTTGTDQMENCMTEGCHWDGPGGELYHCRLPLGWTR